MEFELFNNVKDPILQAYNRVVMVFNLKEDFGETIVRQYLNKVSSKDKHSMLVISNAIEKYGKDTILKQILKREPEEKDNV